MCIDGIKIICVLKIFYNFVLFYDVIVVKKLKENNMIFLGKFNMDEFVMGLLIENFVFYIIRNLWDLERVLGGLSGGFVVVVVVDEVFFIFGFDIGGFIR